MHNRQGHFCPIVKGKTKLYMYNMHRTLQHCDICQKQTLQNKYMGHIRVSQTRSSADADNGLDAFSGQSRSITMALFF